MFSKLTNLFKPLEHGNVKIKFIAVDEEGEPYEDIATVPYHDGYSEEKIKNGFTRFMEIGRKHKVVEIIILERIEKTKD
jgi:hypothetical protein